MVSEVGSLIVFYDEIEMQLSMHIQNVSELYPSPHPSPPTPDVLPDASKSSTLLIKLGLTFKKVC